MAAKSYILAMAQRPFTAFDAEWELVCMLCTELPTLENGGAVIEKQDDGSEGIALTYTIQPEATWGDGTPVTTDDVLFTYEVGSHPESGISNAELYRRIIAIDVVDAKTFVMHVDRVTFDYNAINDFRAAAGAHRAAGVRGGSGRLPLAHAVRRRARQPRACTSAPTAITEVSPGAHVVLEPNPTWWGEAPYFRRIVVAVIENTAALEANLLSGGIDMIAGELGLTVDQALAFEKRHGDRFQIVYKPGLVYEHIDLNLDNPILADRPGAPGAAHGARPRGDRRSSCSPAASRSPTPTSTRSTGSTARTCRATRTIWPRPRRCSTRPAGASCAGGVRHNAAGEPLALELMTTAGNRTRELVAAGAAEPVAPARHRRAHPQRAGARVLRRDHLASAASRHGDVRLDQRARERAAHHAALARRSRPRPTAGRARTTPASATPRWTS